MGVYGGKFAIVDAANTVRQWSISETSTQPKGVASNSQLGTFRRKGVHSWQGTYQGYGATPIRMPGEQFHFKGYTAPTSNVAGTTGLTYDGQAFVSAVTINWDWKTAQIISHTVNFMGHLALTPQAAVPVLDNAVIDDPTTIGTKITWDKATPTAVQQLEALTTAQLTLSSIIVPYVNSDTVINGTCWRGCVSGPIDWTLSMQQETESRLKATDLVLDDIVQLKLFVDATKFWELQFGIVRDCTGITANRETGAVIARTQNVDMMAHNGATMGKVNRPDGTTWWPAVPVGLLQQQPVIKA